MNAGIIMMLLGVAMMFAAPTIRMIELRQHIERTSERSSRAE